ncbi:hypothetical protein SO078_28410 (plasmid) [Sinorhizobium meliloti]|uniref:hypothetical protein n=1 Tax=Rhizobium meliloti TaxID=382 RepID=UPI002D76A0B7|nr:hypothetical protein [Sinorhizobium meliloti]WRQ71162.1 hypothetical protein SO078_28410 [Sinorhizobium meliloti]
MTSLANVEIEPDAARGSRAGRARGQTRNGPFIALALVFLPLNAGTLLYTAKNAADVRESREALAAVKTSIDGLKLQIDRQARNIARIAEADQTAAIRQQVEELGKNISALDDRMHSGFLPSGGSVVLSAPGKDVTQRLKPTSNTRPGTELSEESQPETSADGPSVADLPRYERSVSPEGKLILRKVR